MLRKKLIISISYGYRLRLNVYLRSISQIITEEDYNKKLLKNKSNMVDKYLFFIILSISTKTFYRVASWAHNILTTVTKNIVVDKNTDHNNCGHGRFVKWKVFANSAVYYQNPPYILNSWRGFSEKELSQEKENLNC